ncbi:hypothetical protein NUW58_g455 [Xylaria curta]|uniref:Uncharacterized protein n=1 Tax=Xylaria curta TaxID=42375 RepID=A0ACC1PSH8_9PEZI|nr:hypothetical protein NUW58_g455 [Xylaria curta]
MFVSPLSVCIFGAAFLTLGNCRCQTDSPDAPIPEQWKQTLPQAWDNTVIRSLRESPTRNLTGYAWTLDQVMDGKGTINVCMRWDSNETVTETMREQILAEYTKIYGYWFQWLSGYDNFPFSQVNFNVVGWAVRDQNILQGSLSSFDTYTNFSDESGFPTCNPACAYHNNLDGDYSECPGGPEQRYHQFFFLDQGFWGDHNMGAASGDGIDVSLYGWKTVGSKMDDWPILVHEMGHTFGFLDYLDDGTTNPSVCDNVWIPPNSPSEFVMKPSDYGAHVPKVTEFEGWLLRYFWSRFSRLRGWQNTNTTYPPPPECPSDSS